MSRRPLTYAAICAILAVSVWFPIAFPAEEAKRLEGEYARALESIELTEDEKAAKPDGISDANWRATVFFHRAKVAENNGKVEFYGKAVDQDNQPIEGAKITAHSSYYVESLKEQVKAGGGKTESKEIEATSDADGLFSINGFRARNLRFRAIEKDGYHSSTKLPGGFTFGPQYSSQHDPTPSAPVIFRMWKKGPTEPLIQKHWQKRAAADGRTYSIDLLNSRVIEGGGSGDFQIRVTADYSSITGTSNYTWKVEIVATDGGLIQTDDAYLYGAPENGYQSRIIWKSPSDDAQWTRDSTRKFYVKGPNAKFYASVAIKIIVFHTNSASIQMDTLVNPAGSRNLQFDPSKEM